MKLDEKNRDEPGEDEALIMIFLNEIQIDLII